MGGEKLETLIVSLDTLSGMIWMLPISLKPNNDPSNGEGSEAQKN